MLTFILSALCAISINVVDVSEPRDTTDVYYIDNKLIENFDGSALNGQFIASYRIIREKGKATRIHKIRTLSAAIEDELGKKIKSIDISGGDITYDKVCYILDGRQITSAEFKKIDPKSILSITVHKGEESISKHKDTGDAPVVIKIITK